MGSVRRAGPGRPSGACGGAGAAATPTGLSVPGRGSGCFRSSAGQVRQRRPRVDLPEPDSPTRRRAPRPVRDRGRLRQWRAPCRTSRREGEPQRWSAARTATRRSRTLISGSPGASSSTVVGSGFVGNGHLRSAQRLPVSDGEVIAEQPTVGDVTRLAELRGLAGRANVHGVRATRVEPARGRRIDQVRRRARDGVQGLGGRARSSSAAAPACTDGAVRRISRAPGPVRRSCPAYITATRSQASATTPRLCVMSRMAAE